jgi:hypothetical protein
VLARIGVAAAETATLTQVQNILNQVMLEAHANAKLVVIQTTVTVSANTATANLPTDLIYVESILNGTVVLQPITEQVYGSDTAIVNAGITVTPSTVPTLYTVRLSRTGVPQLAVWPTPTVNTTLTLVYVQRPLTMNSGTDLPGAIPADFHWLLVEAAAERITANEEMFPSGQYAGAQAARLFAGLKAWKDEIAGPTQARVALAYYG